MKNLTRRRRDAEEDAEKTNLFSASSSAPPRLRVKSLPRSGQAAIEFALLYTAVILPLTFMIVFVSQMLWIWHSVNDFTRAVAQFAATHCWLADNSGQNVLNWATSHVPLMIDRGQFQTNAAGIEVAYFSQAADGSLTPFTGSACPGVCVPDYVSVAVRTYQFNRFSSFFKLPNVTMPPFTTLVPMESGGYSNDASGVCLESDTQ